VYEAHYGFRMHPFSLVPDPGFLYLGRRHKLALSLLEYGLLNRSAFSVITGEPGTGKTTLLNTILDRSEREITLGVLSHTHVGLGSLLPWVLMTFGLDGKGMDGVELYRAFATFLAQEHAKHRRVVLVVDEAQNLGSAMLEELRLLSNLNDGRRQPLQIILSGQPSLRALLKQGELVQLAQRISVDYHLEPFAAEETPEYVRHRIRVAGGPVTVMTDLACRVVHHLTHGNPRLINQLCDASLAYGYAGRAATITSQVVSKAATDRRSNGILPLADDGSFPLPSDEELTAEERQAAACSRPTPPQRAQETAPSLEPSGRSMYERGMAFKEAGAFKQAITYFEQAARDPAYGVKSRMQIALCHHASGRIVEAITSLRKLLSGRQATEQETRQIRYLLARALEASGQRDEALQLYRDLRDEHSEYRDVADRFRRLSDPGKVDTVPASGRTAWMRSLSRNWFHLLRSSS